MRADTYSPVRGTTLTELFADVPSVEPLDGGFIEQASTVRTIPYEELYLGSAALLETPADFLQRGVDEAEGDRAA